MNSTVNLKNYIKQPNNKNVNYTEISDSNKAVNN